MTITRLAFQVDIEMKEELESFVPDQLKSEVYRALIRLLIHAQKETSVYMVDDLINDRLVLTKKVTV